MKWPGRGRRQGPWMCFFLGGAAAAAATSHGGVVALVDAAFHPPHPPPLRIGTTTRTRPKPTTLTMARNAALPLPSSCIPRCPSRHRCQDGGSLCRTSRAASVALAARPGVVPSSSSSNDDGEDDDPIASAERALREAEEALADSYESEEDASDLEWVREAGEALRAAREAEEAEAKTKPLSSSSQPAGPEGEGKGTKETTGENTYVAPSRSLFEELSSGGWARGGLAAESSSSGSASASASAQQKSQPPPSTANAAASKPPPKAPPAPEVPPPSSPKALLAEVRAAAANEGKAPLFGGSESRARTEKADAASSASAADEETTATAAAKAAPLEPRPPREQPPRIPPRDAPPSPGDVVEDEETGQLRIVLPTTTSSSSSSGDIGAPKPPAKKKKREREDDRSKVDVDLAAPALSDELRNGALASLAGGLILGALVGLALNVALATGAADDFLRDLNLGSGSGSTVAATKVVDPDSDPYLLPLVLSALSGSISYMLGMQEGFFPGGIVRRTVGGPVLSFWKVVSGRAKKERLERLTPEERADRDAAIRAGALASLASGILLGGLLGLAANVYVKIFGGEIHVDPSALPGFLAGADEFLFDVDPDVDPIALPVLGSAVLGLPSGILGSIDGFPGNLVRSLLGGPVLSGLAAIDDGGTLDERPLLTSKEVRRGAVASLVGGTLLGASLGLAANLYAITDPAGFASIIDVDPELDPAALPVLLGALGGAVSGGFGYFLPNAFPGTAVRTALGGPVLSAWEAIAAVPGDVSSSVRAKADETAAEAIRKAEEVQRAADEAAAKSRAQAEEVQRKADEAATKARAMADKVASEASALPGRVSESAKEAIEAEIGLWTRGGKAARDAIDDALGRGGTAWGEEASSAEKPEPSAKRKADADDDSFVFSEVSLKEFVQKDARARKESVEEDLAKAREEYLAKQKAAALRKKKAAAAAAEAEAKRNAALAAAATKAAEAEARREAKVREQAIARKDAAKRRREAAEERERRRAEDEARRAAAAEERRVAAEARKREAEAERAAAAAEAEERKRRRAEAAEERERRLAEERERRRREAEVRRAAMAAEAEAKRAAAAAEAEERRRRQAEAAEERERKLAEERAARQREAEAKRAAAAAEAEERTRRRAEEQAARRREAEAKRATAAAAEAEARRRREADAEAAAKRRRETERGEGTNEVYPRGLASFFGGAKVDPPAGKAESKEETGDAAALPKFRSFFGGGTTDATPAEDQDEAKREKGGDGAAPPGFASFFGGMARDAAAGPAESPRPPPAPKGATTPSLSRWSVNPDGSVSGFVSGSRSYRDGTFVTTSPMKRSSGRAIEGAVIVTESDSRFYLEGPGKEAGTISFPSFGFDWQDKAAEDASRSTPSPPTPPTPNARTGGAPESPPQKKRIAAVPRGVPVLTRWVQNADGSIFGYISKSRFFGRGEPITTSPIKGKAVEGSVVETESGSRYFLEERFL